MQSLVSLLAGEVSHCPVHINTCRSVTATIHVHAHCQYCIKFIPANFFWDISVRFLSCECWDVWRRHDHVWRFPKKSEVFWRRSFHLLFTSKNQRFYTWFSFLTWVWVNIFLEIVSSKMATTHIFQSGVRNWPASVSWREIKVFNPQAWELAGI